MCPKYVRSIWPVSRDKPRPHSAVSANGQAGTEYARSKNWDFGSYVQPYISGHNIWEGQLDVTRE